MFPLKAFMFDFGFTFRSFETKFSNLEHFERTCVLFKWPHLFRLRFLFIAFRFPLIDSGLYHGLLVEEFFSNKMFHFCVKERESSFINIHFDLKISDSWRSLSFLCKILSWNSSRVSSGRCFGTKYIHSDPAKGEKYKISEKLNLVKTFMMICGLKEDILRIK